MTIADQIRARLDAVADERRRLDDEERRLRAAPAALEGNAPAVPAVPAGMGPIFPMTPAFPTYPAPYIQQDTIVWPRQYLPLGPHWTVPPPSHEPFYCGDVISICGTDGSSMGQWTCTGTIS